MRTKVVLLLIIFGVLPMLSLAASINFFEYAPDPWQSKRLITSSVDTPSQLFRPNQDAILTGFDFWLDNASDPGVITFTLADEQETVLAERTVSIPHISPLPGGKKFHVDLVNEVNLTKESLYSIKMTSSLLGLGLYYADRITSLEHNLPFTSEYYLGAAKFGSELQEITFKFALYRRIDTGAGENPPPEEEEEEDEPITIAITNARVAALTDTTALLAWTTDIAADSRVIIRTQLNPLYTVYNVYDSTIELEHTVLVEDLIPEANYFADVFSTQGNSIMLTTYTIGFQTLTKEEAQAEEEDEGDAEEENGNEGQEEEDPGTTEEEGNGEDDPADDPADNDSSEETTPSTTSEDPDISVSPGSRSNNTNIEWASSSGEEPSDGYRIDIFDYNYNLERTIEVPAGTHSKEVAHLGSGVHHVVVYENNDGVYTKVTEAETFTLKTNFGSITFSVIGIILLWVVSFVLYISWKIKKSRNVLPPEEGYDPEA